MGLHGRTTSLITGWASSGVRVKYWVAEVEWFDLSYRNNMRICNCAGRVVG